MLKTKPEQSIRTHGAEVIIGEPCPDGHTLRYKNGGGCVTCHLEWAREQAIRVKQGNNTALAKAERTIRGLRKEIRTLKASG